MHTLHVWPAAQILAGVFYGPEPPLFQKTWKLPDVAELR
jgi:hypothetical protein